MISMNYADVVSALGDTAANQINATGSFSGCSTDTRTLEKDNLYIALKGERFDGHDFVKQAQDKGAACLLLEKSVHTDIPTIQVKDSRKAMGALANVWRKQLNTPIVAVTGSNGKTTVKEMLKQIFSKAGSVHATQGNLNNDIGVPLTLFKLSASDDYAVIEMGANHAGEIAYLTELTQPDVATITQCAPAHLEGFGSIEGVARAKAEIFQGLGESGVAVINADDDYADYWQDCVKQKRQLTFGVNAQADVTARNIEVDLNGCYFQLYSPNGNIEIHLPLLGEHNVMNALAAAACAIAINIELETIQQGLAAMQAVKGRLQRVKGINGSLIIDDTYNANPKSLSAAIDTVTAKTKNAFLVLGDMGELGDDALSMHEQAGVYARSKGINRLFTLGELSQHACVGFGESFYSYENHAALAKAIKPLLNEEVVVLVKGSRTMHMEDIVSLLAEVSSC